MFLTFILPIGQLAPFLEGPLSDNLRRLNGRAVQHGRNLSRPRVTQPIGQLAPFRPQLSDNLRRFASEVSDNLRRFQDLPIGQLAPKLSDNLRRLPWHYRTTCAEKGSKLSDNLRQTIGQLAPFCPENAVLAQDRPGRLLLSTYIF
ncbi:hypothetical protein [Deinococcus aquaedulcis]|uniref:hypothetical protein n=1 Tax=Deinococcus aquaedulcis TaxID=2840455 RepID=UPI001C840175|nr:hypothetical protein [Deinococcus aquaedulcis]